MTTVRNIVMMVGIVGLVAVALFLGGCEEEGVGILSGTNVSATRVETFGMEFEAPLSLDIDTSNGHVTVRGIAGIQTASVTVTLRSRGGTLEEAEDRLGRIVYRAAGAAPRISLQYRSNEQDDDVRRHSGVDFDVLVPIDSRVEVDTSNGAVSLEGIRGTMILDTSNGAIDVYNSTGTLIADTSNGRIEVIAFVGELQLDTSNGDVWIEDFAGTVDAETSNGSVHFTGEPTAGGNRIRTSNGSITVRVPLRAAIAFDASTSSGRIRSGLPLVGDVEGDEWSADLNPPAAVTFALRTSNGTIRIEGTDF